MRSRERARRRLRAVALALALVGGRGVVRADQTPAATTPPVQPVAPPAPPVEPAAPAPPTGPAAPGAPLPVTPSTFASGRPEAVAGVGIFGLDADEDQASVLDMEVRWRPVPSPAWLRIEPVVGAEITGHGTMYARAGLGRDFPLGQRWNTNISLAAGGYLVGNGKQLGRGVEFRSAIELSCLLHEQVRLGLALAHLSNAGLGSHNPGVETLTITFGWLDPFVPRRR